MRTVTAILFAVSLGAQAQTFHPLHVSAGGNIVDDTGKPVMLRGINRSGTGSGNADANSTDAEYAAQNQLLSMNLVRLFVNATWWNSNVQVPIANQKYQDYIDALIQRAKKYGNYVLVVKAGQFPDAPCGSDGKNCPAPNQGDLNCQANASLCAAQDTTGNNIDTAFTFWSGFAKKYGADPAVLYDTWEDMHSIDNNTWSNDQNQLILAIRSYNPQALIFVEDIPGAFEAVTAGTLADIAFPNVVWNFHLFNASTGSCTEPASPRYANWSQAIDPLVSFAQQHGHAAAITEWGGCNDSDPYHTNITSYAKLHELAVAYFDSSNVLTSSAGSFQLTVTGSKVAQAYTSLAAVTSGPAPTIMSVVNAESDKPPISPNTWVAIHGSNLAPPGDIRIWQGYDFFNSQLPPEMDGVSVKVNGKTAYIYYISPTQINILTPTDAMLGPVSVTVTSGGVTSTTVTTPAQAESLALFVVNGGPYVLAEHTNGDLLGPTGLFPTAPNATTPAKPGETAVIYGTGFNAASITAVNGALSQSGTLPSLPVIKIGGVPANVLYAGVLFPGEYQINVVVPSTLADGDQPITLSYDGLTTQSGLLITVHH